MNIKTFYSAPLPADQAQSFFERTGRAIGLIAIFLPLVPACAALLGLVPMRDSLSHFYYTRWMGDFFVGGLYFIGIMMFFLYHTGHQQVIGWSNLKPWETWAIRLIGLLAIVVASFPANGKGGAIDAGVMHRSFTLSEGASPLYQLTLPADGGREWGSTLHFSAAFAMFLLLFYFLAVVFRRDQREKVTGDVQMLRVSHKDRRNTAYSVLAAVMLLALCALGYDAAAGASNDSWWDAFDLTFVCEALALWMFGLGWLIKGRAFPYFNDQ